LFTRPETQPSVTEKQLTQETANFLHERAFESIEEAQQAAEEFVKFCRGRAWVFCDAGTTESGESLYTFTHRTFLEYFTASYLIAVHDTPEQLAAILIPHLARAEWTS